MRPRLICILVTLLRYRRCVRSTLRSNVAIVALIACVFLVWIVLSQPLMAHAQYSTGIPSGPSRSGMSLTPSLSVGERYDTNVWFAPAQLLPPGTQLWDFVTTVQGSVKGLYKDKNVDASLTAGVDANTYVYNTGLGYFSTRADLYANLNGFAEHFVKGAQWRIYDYFRYTPQSPGFLTGGKAGTEDPFLRGVQSFRANTFSNTFNTDGFVPVFRDLAIQARYAFSNIRLGSPINTTATGAVQFFDTTMHSWSLGPRLRLTSSDAVALLYQQNLITQQLAAVGSTNVTGATSTIDTNTQTVTANYYRATTFWSFAVGGGATLIEPANKTFPTGLISISNNPERSTTAQLTLSRQAFPSFYINAGANISNLATLQVTHRYTKLLTLRGSVNYGYNQTVPLTTNTTFTNFTLSAGLNYRITRTLSFDLYYDHNDFKTDSPGISYTVLRNVVGFFLTAEWR